MADDTKIYPATSSEIGRMFNLEGEHTVDSGIVTAKSASPAGLPVFDESSPAGLPVSDESFSNADVEMEPDSVRSIPAGLPVAAEDDYDPTNFSSVNYPEPKALEEKTPEAKVPVDHDAELAERMKDNKANAALNIGKKILPYIVVFAIGIGIYYFYFSDFSFLNIFKGVSIPTISQQAKPDAALASLEETERANYNVWISQFFFDVTDSSITDMDTDVSGNGLTNFQKYLLNLNPKIYDSRGDGVADGQAIIEGKNPWTGLAMNDEQKKIATTYFDNEVISNRITAALANRSNAENLTPYVSNNSPYYVSSVSNPNNGNAGTVNVVTNNGTVTSTAVPTSQQVAGAATNPGNGSAPAQNNSTINIPRTSPTTGVNNVSNNIGGAVLDIDTNIPGSVNISSIKVTVPVIWSSNVKNFDSDLKKGVVHFPGTPLPGEVGSSYISGHSSGFLFDKSPYKQAFAKIGNLKNGDSFTVTVTLRGGKKAILHYVVGGRAEYAANDQRQFLQTPDSVVALSTCWPPNTAARRLVVFGKLTQIEK